jgi:hypothetical protein
MATASRLFSTERRQGGSSMERIRTVVGSGMLVALFACSGGASDPAESSTSSSPPASSAPAAPTVLEGTWRSVLDADALEQRGFSAKQIQLLQVQDEWSSREVNEIRVTGDTWMLLQGTDGKQPEETGNLGQIRVTPDTVRMEEAGTCFHVWTYELHGDELQMTFLRSTCDIDPIEPIPDFMYAAVFGQPFQRQGTR